MSLLYPEVYEPELRPLSWLFARRLFARRLVLLRAPVLVPADPDVSELVVEFWFDPALLRSPSTELLPRLAFELSEPDESVPVAPFVLLRFEASEPDVEFPLELLLFDDAELELLERELSD